MNNKQNYLACAVLACLTGLFGQAYADDVQTVPLPPEAPAMQPLENQAVQAPEDQAVQAPESQTGQAPEDQAVQAPDDQAVQPPESQTVQTPEEDRVIPRPTDSGSIEIKSFPGKRYSLSPLPVDIYVMKGQRPIITFTTPCIEIEKLTNGFPPIIAFENFMFTFIGNVNDSELLPVRLEPVCI